MWSSLFSADLSGFIWESWIPTFIQDFWAVLLQGKPILLQGPFCLRKLHTHQILFSNAASSFPGRIFFPGSSFGPRFWYAQRSWRTTRERLLPVHLHRKMGIIITDNRMRAWWVTSASFCVLSSFLLRPCPKLHKHSAFVWGKHSQHTLTSQLLGSHQLCCQLYSSYGNQKGSKLHWIHFEWTKNKESEI